jgi:hypothetical protein
MRSKSSYCIDELWNKYKNTDENTEESCGELSLLNGIGPLGQWNDRILRYLNKSQK